MDDRVLAPSLTRLDKRVQYVTYDIADMLTAGENTVAIWYGPGWSRYRFFKSACQQILKVQFNGRYSDGRKLAFASDSTWRWLEFLHSHVEKGMLRICFRGERLLRLRLMLNDHPELAYPPSPKATAEMSGRGRGIHPGIYTQGGF